MPPVGFEPTISAGEWPQTYALDRAATGTGSILHYMIYMIYYIILYYIILYYIILYYIILYYIILYYIILYYIILYYIIYCNY